MDIFWCVKDEDGVLRPLAGLWRDNEYGKQDAQAYADKEGVEVVRIKLIEQ